MAVTFDTDVYNEIRPNKVHSTRNHHHIFVFTITNTKAQNAGFCLPKHTFFPFFLFRLFVFESESDTCFVYIKHDNKGQNAGFSVP